jgi:uncharacterized protein with HEPN domain
MVKYNRDAELLKHILKYCDRTQYANERFGASFEIFKTDFEYQSACSMYILQIGELSNKLSEGLKSRYSDVPWREIIGMRNLFAHDYENIDIKKVWETMGDDIAPLRMKCLQMILELEPDYDYDSAQGEEELLADDEDESGF